MTTTPQQRIEADLKTAMKAGEKYRLSTSTCFDRVRFPEEASVHSLEAL